MQRHQSEIRIAILLLAYALAFSLFARAEPSVSFIENRGTGSPSSMLPGWTPSVIVWITDPSAVFQVTIHYSDRLGAARSATMECSAPICEFAVDASPSEIQGEVE